MSPSAKIEYQRIVVAVDASHHGRVALEAAADLAKELQAELQGLFVEDVNLLRLAGLPFAHEIMGSSAAQRQLELSRMERKLRANAEQVRAALASTAVRAKVQWSFGIARGHLAQTTLAAADEADLSIVGHESLSLRVVPSRRTVRAEARIAVVYDGTPTSQRALDLATRFVSATSADLLLLIRGANAEDVKELQAQCNRLLPPEQRWTGVDLSSAADAQTLIEAVHAYRPRLLFINRDNALLSKDTFERLISELACPVGLVR